MIMIIDFIIRGISIALFEASGLQRVEIASEILIKTGNY